jgi:hypothetical protein
MGNSRTNRIMLPGCIWIAVCFQFPFMPEAKDRSMTAGKRFVSKLPPYMIIFPSVGM